jgi:hypothetical protein
MTWKYTGSCTNGPPGPCTGGSEAACPGVFIGTDTASGTPVACQNANAGVSLPAVIEVALPYYSSLCAPFSPHWS